MKGEELSKLIHYVDIGMDLNTDLTRWIRPLAKTFHIDIMSCRASATDEYYQRIEKSESRILYIRKNQITFIISSSPSIQFQMLEAILDDIIFNFFHSYGEICSTITCGDSNLYDGFQMLIPSILEDTKEKIRWLRVPTKICITPLKVCVKKSLIENATHFPVAIVYFHRGSGILIYIDAKFKVRGAEIVSITG